MVRKKTNLNGNIKLTNHEEAANVNSIGDLESNQDKNGVLNH